MPQYHPAPTHPNPFTTQTPTQINMAPSQPFLQKRLDREELENAWAMHQHYQAVMRERERSMQVYEAQIQAAVKQQRMALEQVQQGKVRELGQKSRPTQPQTAPNSQAQTKAPQVPAKRSREELETLENKVARQGLDMVDALSDFGSDGTTIAAAIWLANRRKVRAARRKIMAGGDLDSQDGSGSGSDSQDGRGIAYFSQDDSDRDSDKSEESDFI